ncbi:carbonate dehydratase [Rhodocytophaga rosea]|uniref:Carbonic anhydrase 2 n=2 Tax=Rhodocytophaga rosea TaxID=2704465 RepID=A0A6C0GX53_9BACT|nr:carbonate dehydratase [Rhodocytophaga rosea]
MVTNFRYDFRSGLVVFLVALPLCLGIALASGAPLFSGIIAGIIGGIIVGSLSGSSLSVSGPAAGLTVIVFSAIEKFNGQFNAFLLAVMLAGVLQIILGYIRAGSIGYFFPSAVIKGMLAAIGLTLILKQIPHALGYDEDAEGEFAFEQLDGENTFTEILRAFQNPNAAAIIITLISVAILLLWERPALKKYSFFNGIPAPLVVVLISILINYLYNYISFLSLSGNHLVSLPKANNFNEFLGLFTLPDFSQIGNPQVYITAATLAIVASLETLLNVEATDKLDPLKRNTPPNRELKAQGVGNLISGLIGGLPLTSVIVRSSVNINTGARSKMSAVIHGILLLVCVISIPSLLNRIPLACLAAILILTGYKLAKLKVFKEMYSLGLSQFIPFVVTIVAVLFTDLLIGISIGLAVGLFFILRANYKSFYFFQREKLKGGEKVKINLGEHVSFLNKASINNILENLPENSYVEIDGSKSQYIDYDILETIENFKSTAKQKNIRFTFNKNGHDGQPTAKTYAPVPVPQVDQTAYDQLFENNRKWVAEKLKLDPHYFENLAMGQSPKYLWIGCSDSRVPASEITGTHPGEMFVHRNVANLVVSTDLNLLSVLQYAVEVLKVEHIIVCGHYGCGGVKAAIEDNNLGLINKWLLNIKDVYRLHKDELMYMKDPNEQFKRLVELNVIEQVYNLHKTSIVQKAWLKDAKLHVHGWVYDLREGSIKDLEVDIRKTFAEYDEIFRFKDFQ